MGGDNERFHKGLDYVMTFGKHEAKTLEEICAEDPQYLYWLAYSGPKYKLKTEVIREAQRFGADFAKDKM